MFHSSADLIQLGAYISGSNTKLDASIRTRETVLNFLRQDTNEKSDLNSTLSSLVQIAAGV